MRSAVGLGAAALAAGALVAAWIIRRRRAQAPTPVLPPQPEPEPETEPETDPEPALRVVDFEGSGRGYVANRAIEAGATLFREKPLLVVPASHEQGANPFMARLRAYCEASEHVQRKILTHFCCPLEEFEADRSSHCVRFCELLDGALRDVPAAWTDAGHSRDELRKALVCFMLNSHSFEDGSALFERGCLFNHSCDPNVVYVEAAGELAHVALRPIAEGEPLCVNYLGEDAIVATPMRQALLLTKKLFLCACSRCRKAELGRAAPCVHCHPRPLMADGDGQRDGGAC